MPPMNHILFPEALPAPHDVVLPDDAMFAAVRTVMPGPRSKVVRARVEDGAVRHCVGLLKLLRTKLSTQLNAW